MEWILSIATMIGGLASLYYFFEKLKTKKHQEKTKSSDDIEDFKQDFGTYILSNFHKIKDCQSCVEYSSDFRNLYDVVSRIRTMSGLKRVKRNISKLSIVLAECPSCSKIAIGLYDYENKIEGIVSEW